MKYEFIGKCLLIEEKEKKILVIGDLHLGFERVLRSGGVMLPLGVVKEVLEELGEVFGELERREEIGERRGEGEQVVDEVVLLGDLKHDFGRNEIDEYKEIGEILNFLRARSGKVVIIKGNHDAVLGGVIEGLANVEIKDYYVYGGVGFLHGDKRFEGSEVYDKNVKMWVMGHGHPAVRIGDSTKEEKYKCFLEGVWKGRKIVIVPSFFSINEGTDYREYDLGLAWEFDLKKFRVWVVSEGLEVLDFGIL